jgi:myo-inositol 2-dehydrogenase/D-chiro-inositol 1-dehydrogenase
MLRAGNVAPTTVERSGADSTCGDNPWPNFQTRYAAAYAAELSSFINSVERRKPSEVPPEDSRRVLLLCEAARKSATTGQPVKVSRS